MNFDWQNVTALVLVLAAIVYGIRRVLRAGTRNRPPGCGSCPKCPQNRAANGYRDDTTA